MHKIWILNLYFYFSKQYTKHVEVSAATEEQIFFFVNASKVPFYISLLK
jgi:hypothetical protein